MSYTPPAGDDVELIFDAGGYTPPAGDDVELIFITGSNYSQSVEASVSVSAAQSRSVGIRRAASASTAVALRKAVLASRSASKTCAAAVQKAMAHHQSASATTGASAITNIVRGVTIAASATVSAARRIAVSATRTATATCAGVVRKAVSRTISIVGSGNYFSDSGAGSNANPVGGAWSTSPGFNQFQRLSGVLIGTASGANNGAYVNAPAFADDQWIEFRWVNGTDPGAGCGGMLRVADNGSGQTNAYLFQWFPSNNIHIARWSGGSYTALATGSHSFAAGDVGYFEAVGSVLTAKINGSIVLTYDTASDSPKYTTGQPGLYNFSDFTTGLDSIEAGDFGAGGIVVSAACESIRVKIVEIAASVAASAVVVKAVSFTRACALAIAPTVTKVVSLPRAAGLTAAASANALKVRIVVIAATAVTVTAEITKAVALAIAGSASTSAVVRKLVGIVRGALAALDAVANTLRRIGNRRLPEKSRADVYLTIARADVSTTASRADITTAEGRSDTFDGPSRTDV